MGIALAYMVLPCRHQNAWRRVHRQWAQGRSKHNQPFRLLGNHRGCNRNILMHSHLSFHLKKGNCVRKKETRVILIFLYSTENATLAPSVAQRLVRLTLNQLARGSNLRRGNIKCGHYTGHFSAPI